MSLCATTSTLPQYSSPVWATDSRSMYHNPSHFQSHPYQDGSSSGVSTNAQQQYLPSPTPTTSSTRSMQTGYLPRPSEIEADGSNNIDHLDANVLPPIRSNQFPTSSDFHDPIDRSSPGQFSNILPNPAHPSQTQNQAYLPQQYPSSQYSQYPAPPHQSHQPQYPQQNAPDARYPDHYRAQPPFPQSQQIAPNMPRDERYQNPIKQERYSEDGPSSIPPERSRQNTVQIKQEAQPSSTQNTEKQEKPEEFKQVFQFISQNETSNARNIVRKHVMKEYRRRERFEMDKLHGGTSTSTTKPSAAQADGPARVNKKTAPAKAKPATASQLANGIAKSLNLSPVSASSQLTDPMKSENASDSAPSPTSVAVAQSAARNKKAARSGVLDFSGSKKLLDRDARATSVNSATASTRSAGTLSTPSPLPDEDDEPERNYPMAMQQDPEMKRFLEHYARDMPDMMDETCLGRSFNRPGWLHTSVAPRYSECANLIKGHALGFMSRVKGLPEPPEAIKAKNDAVRQIIERWADERTRTNDDSVTALASMAGFSMAEISPEVAAVHLNGLAGVTDARGGMESYVRVPRLHTILLRIDCMRGYICMAPFRFPNWEACQAVRPLAVHVGPQEPHNINLETATHSFQYLCCDDALRLIHELEGVLNNLLQSSQSENHSDKDLTSVGYQLRESMLDILRRRNRQKYYRTESWLPPMPFLENFLLFRNSSIREAIRLAALIVITVAINEYFDKPATKVDYFSLAVSVWNRVQTSQKRRSMSIDMSDSPSMSISTSSSSGSDDASRKPPHDPYAWPRSIQMLFVMLLRATLEQQSQAWRAFYASEAITNALMRSEWSAIVDDLWKFVQSYDAGDGACKKVGWNLRDLATEWSLEWRSS